MTRRTDQIGFSQRVRLEWLEQTANLVLAGNDKARAVNDAVAGAAEGQGVLRRPGRARQSREDHHDSPEDWLTVPSELESLASRRPGTPQAYSSTRSSGHPLGDGHGRLPVLVGCSHAGRPSSEASGLCCRGSCPAAGPRAIWRAGDCFPAARRVLRSYLDWGVLQETGTKGIYSAGATLAVDDSRLIAWLVEASLHARANGSAPLKDLIDSPSLFPFRIKPVHAESLVAASSRLDVLRHGLDDDLVMLRRTDHQRMRTLTVVQFAAA